MKFKILDKRDNTWLTDYEEVFMNENGEIFLIEERSWGYESYMHKENITDDVEVVWFTGLKDRNDKEIYKGDILLTDLDRPYLIVEFRNGAFMYQCHDDGKDYYDFMLPPDKESEKDEYLEVIGNIYENPELLKERD